MLFADSIPIAYCRREKVVEVLICFCIDCGDIICFSKITSTFREVS